MRDIRKTLNNEAAIAHDTHGHAHGRDIRN